jgi:AraC-like DNA-binding protein
MQRSRRGVSPDQPAFAKICPFRRGRARAASRASGQLRESGGMRPRLRSNLSPDHAAMLRRRHVRLRYPQAYVDLAIRLAARHGRLRSANALGLSLSTVYRWVDAARQNPQEPTIGDAGIEELLSACAAHGFDLRQRVQTLEPLPALAPPALVAAAPAPPHALRAPGVARLYAAPLRPAPLLDAGARPAPATDPGTAHLSAGVRARLRSARNEIEQRYYAPLSCEQLAAVAGMSRFHFIRMFKSAYAVAPYRYLMQVRVGHARQLLSTTAQPLDVIAAAVGFDSPSLLSKAFKSIEGISLARAFQGVRLGARPPAAPLAARF